VGWIDDRCRRGNARLVDQGCENVDGTCCRRLVARVGASAAGEVSEAGPHDLWQMVILIDC